MIEVHVQAEGAFPNITGRRALLRRLPELTLQPADDRQREMAAMTAPISSEPLPI